MKIKHPFWFALAVFCAIINLNTIFTGTGPFVFLSIPLFALNSLLAIWWWKYAP